MRKLRVASRKSALAMTQTKWVISELQKLESGLEVDIVPLVTKGDKILDVALSKVGGKGLFVSEIEQALLDGTADFAVHSLKDVPAVLAAGMVLAGIPKREDPRDALISRGGRRFVELPKGAVVGTSSLRRMAQLSQVRPDLDIRPLRGNIDTRLRKLETEEMDAIILAAAGLHRMGWADVITEYLDASVCLPAIGQAVLGIECRADDDDVVALLERMTDLPTKVAAQAERALLAALNGGCQVPIAGYATVTQEGDIRLQGLVGSPDGQVLLQAEATGRDAALVGQKVAEQLIQNGAEDILAGVRDQ